MKTAAFALSCAIVSAIAAPSIEAQTAKEKESEMLDVMMFPSVPATNVPAKPLASAEGWDVSFLGALAKGEASISGTKRTQDQGYDSIILSYASPLPFTTKQTTDFWMCTFELPPAGIEGSTDVFSILGKMVEMLPGTWEVVNPYKDFKVFRFRPYKIALIATEKTSIRESDMQAWGKYVNCFVRGATVRLLIPKIRSSTRVLWDPEGQYYWFNKFTE
jgi:hypothetical protein